MAGRATGGNRVLLRMPDGTTTFRVYHDGGNFTDYDIRHDDLPITIDADALAAFYQVGERTILDHSPEVLGLRKIESA